VSAFETRPVSSQSAKPVVLIVIDGLTPTMFEAAVGDRRAPSLTFLAERGRYDRAVTTFPSLTPVCLSSLVTGAHPDVHHIPHLVWYVRGERRVVEYGSSFAALRAAGMARAILDTIINMNRKHLSRNAVTLFEALEDAGRVTAAVNITCYRGRTPHYPTLPGIPIPAYGPKQFFYYNLFESERTGAPLAVFARAAGSVDGYAASVGRWLVTRGGFSFLAYYLPDYDFASHTHGPDSAHEALERSDAAVGALFDAAGGPDEFLERYAVVFCSDHGQTRVGQHAVLEAHFADRSDVVVTASNRAGMVYGSEPRALAERLDGDEAVDVALFREDGEFYARRDGEEVRLVPGVQTDLLDEFPDAVDRVVSALRNPNAGDVIVSAKPGFEFADLAGRHHVGGGSHGSLTAGDSQVPMLTIGIDHVPRKLVDVAPTILQHLGVAPPPYQRASRTVAV
jgi:predicted AlkP superfamily pyrophosphatase or phosphodiesterase